MKKRMLSILLTLCMVLSLLPTAALAGGVGTEENYLVVSDWEGLQAAMTRIETETADPVYQGIKVKAESFGWPEDERTLVIDFENDGKPTAANQAPPATSTTSIWWMPLGRAAVPGRSPQM